MILNTNQNIIWRAAKKFCSNNSIESEREEKKGGGDRNIDIAHGFHENHDYSYEGCAKMKIRNSKAFADLVVW